MKRLIPFAGSFWLLKMFLFLFFANFLIQMVGSRSRAKMNVHWLTAVADTYEMRTVAG